MRKRFLVKQELSKKSVSELLTYGNSVVSHVNGNSFFATPHPSLAACSTALAELETAVENALEGSIEETQIQIVKRITVENLFSEMGHYVEDVANDPANATPIELPMQIIESANMQVRAFSPRQKRAFGARTGKMPGEVDIFAAKVSRGFHEWQYTITPNDPGSWVDLNSTTKASTMATGLTALTVYAFRHRAVLKSGPEPWEDPINVLVL